LISHRSRKSSIHLLGLISICKLIILSIISHHNVSSFSSQGPNTSFEDFIFLDNNFNCINEYLQAYFLVLMIVS